MSFKVVFVIRTIKMGYAILLGISWIDCKIIQLQCVIKYLIEQFPSLRRLSILERVVSACIRQGELVCVCVCMCVCERKRQLFPICNSKYQYFPNKFNRQKLVQGWPERNLFALLSFLFCSVTGFFSFIFFSFTSFWVSTKTRSQKSIHLARPVRSFAMLRAKQSRVIPSKTGNLRERTSDGEGGTVLIVAYFHRTCCEHLCSYPWGMQSYPRAADSVHSPNYRARDFWMRQL